MERRYDASIAGVEPVYQPPNKSWALSAQAQWLAKAAIGGAPVQPMPLVAGTPTLKERIALRREIVQGVEAASGYGDLPQWLSIFNQIEPLLGRPTVDLLSDSPGGRTGSWIHELLNRAVNRPTPRMLALVAGMMARWVPEAIEDHSRLNSWSLLVSPLPVMELWRADLADRFDFLLIDAVRNLLEQGLAIDRSDKHKALSLRAIGQLLHIGSIMDQKMCPSLQPPGERHFTHALGHLRLQVDALVPAMGLTPGIPHPQHAPASFRYVPDVRGAVPTSTWKTGACSIIDCFEHSRLLRAHILTTRGAFDSWTRALVKALNALPAEQSSLPLKRIDALSNHPQIRERPGFLASLKQTVMLNITPVAAAGDTPKPAPRF